VRGGDLVGSWRIPIYSLWGAMNDGLSQDELVAQGRDDVVTQATTDLAYSQRDAMSNIGQNNEGIIGYWRVPTGGSSCDFCNLIADQLYHVEDLMPVHPACSCTVEPAFASDTADGGEGEG